uniref:Uncharacterized protein n=1 Tax=Anguilla anguilla TaxID=7936 RepID=A0A0E9XT91_ANGAN
MMLSENDSFVSLIFGECPAAYDSSPEIMNRTLGRV